MSEITKAADIKRIIEGKIGQMVEVAVIEGKGMARISVNTLFNHQRFSLGHMLTAEAWAGQGYEIDLAAVRMADLLNASLLREVEKFKQHVIVRSGTKCGRCIYSPGYSPMCMRCRDNSLFIEA